MKERVSALKRDVRVRERVLLAVVLALAAAQVLPAGAQAAFPGQNGKIAFDSTRDGFREIYVMNANGSGQTRLTNNAAADTAPAWSPDGAERRV